MRNILIVLLILFIKANQVQAEGFLPYEWEKVRTRIALSEKEKAMGELILKNHAEYTYGFEQDKFLQQNVVHKIIYVNSSESIQRHNRISISMNNVVELVDLKARAINPDGKVVLFDRNNLKELKEEEGNKAYRIFAIEGVELGSEIEYYYVLKLNSRVFDRLFMQSDVLIKNSSFILRSPKHLKFDFKTYNGFPEIKTTEGEQENTYSTEMKDVPPLKNEAFSFYTANLKRIEFKIAYNMAKSRARLNTWDDASKRFFSVLSENGADDEKALVKYLKRLEDKPAAALATRIKDVENRVKASISVNTEAGTDPNLFNLASILKFNVASKAGMAKLFYNVYTRLGIPCKIVMTCDRENAKFDGSFDTWGYLDDYFLFFPETKGFMAPYEMSTRYPLIPANNMEQYGLFIEPINIGGVSSALGAVEKIPSVDYSFNTDHLEINVEFIEDMSQNRIKMKRSMSGYNASFILPYTHLLTETQLKTLTEDVIKQTAPDPVITKWSAKPVTESGLDKFVFDVDFKSSHFLESAGSNLLFKVGELIGPQTELYSDDERTTSVENGYNRGYDRTIIVTLPEGYSIRNADALKFDVKYKDNENTPFLFQSDYKITGNILAITLVEYYKEISVPLSRYEDYRKVINSSADFNKVTLILEKKK